MNYVILTDIVIKSLSACMYFCVLTFSSVLHISGWNSSRPIGMFI